MKTLKQLFLTLLASLALLLPAVPVTAQGLFDDACKNVSDSTLCTDKSSPQTKESNTIYGQNGIITKAIRIVSFVVGFAAIVMIIVGGFKYVTATGDPNNINSAKNTILYALIGLVIASVSQGIIVFVLNKL